MQDYYWWLDVSRRVQSHPDMPRLTRVEFGLSEGHMSTTEVIQKEKLLEYKAKSVFFYYVLHKLSIDQLKCALIQSDCKIIYLIIRISRRKQSMS